MPLDVIARQAKSFAPGEIAPLMTGGTLIARYESPVCRAILFERPTSKNPSMEFLHALIAYQPIDNKPPFIFIVAERVSAVGLPKELREAAGRYLGDEVFLCAYTKRGKYNLGPKPGLSDLTDFEETAKNLLRETLGADIYFDVTEDVRVGTLTGEPRPQPTGKTGCAMAFLSLVGVGYGFVQFARLLG